MDELSRSRLVARRVLSWWSDVAAADTPVAAPAVPIDALVDRLGLEVTTFHPAARRGGTLGWLEPGENLIFLRDDLPEPVRRFTLAHELGHALLHRTTGLSPAASALLAADRPPSIDADTEGELELEASPAPACEDVDLDAPVDALSLGDEALRPGQAYSARARRESEANAFAAALLLPPGALRTLFLGDDSTPGISPRQLAERFGVSEETVHQALAGLLLPGAVESADGPAVTRLGGSSGRPALDRWQRAAAAAQAPALVVAGPGTGKTSTLVGRVAHLVFDEGLDPSRIQALTFSNKAAQEMRERLDALLAEAPGASSPSARSARPTVSTIHAFCGDLLRRYGPLVGLRSDYRLISEVEGYLLLREVASGLVLPYFQPLAAPAMHFPALLSSISRAKDELADPIQYALLAERMAAQARSPEERTAASRAREVARVYAAYQRALSEAGNADFGDLIRLAVRVLQEHPDALADLRERHPHILVDEFQDINRAMGVLLRVLAGPDGQIWAVGDADQAIYRFRGASPANLARFTEAYPSARIYPLATNYRSRPPILGAAHAVASALLSEGERAVLEAAYQSSTPPADSSGEDTVVTLASAPDEASELAGLAATIREYVARGYALADQAVLCRTRRQCQRVADALDAAGFPARVVTPLLEQPDIKNVLSVVLLLTDVSGSGLLRAGSIEDHPFSRDETLAMLRAAQERHLPPMALLLAGGSGLDQIEGLTPEGRAGLVRLGEIAGRLWGSPDVATGLAQYVFSLTGLGRRALSDASAAGRVRAATLARLLALVRAFEDQRRAVAPARAYADAGGAHWSEFVDYVRVLTALGREVAASDDILSVASDGVRVLTVHGSKGLEFPIVHLPNLAEGRFPTQRRGEVAPLPPGLSEDETLSARDAAAHLAEEACLFYVAITRARDALVISHAERYGKRRASPSPFLKPLMPLAAEPRSGVARVRWPAVAEVTRAAQDADDLADAPVPPAPSQPEPIISADEPVHVGAIETYQRCPRQYAYRYVYRLRPREIGLGTLRRSLHETLRELQARIASDASAAGVHPREPGFPTLSDALELFEQRWREAVAAEAEARRRGDLGDEDSARGLDGPFGALYRRHGQRVIERAWLDLLRERGLPLPDGMEAPPLWRDDPTGGEGTAPGADVRPGSEAGAGERRSAPVPLGARLEERVLVRVGGRTIEVTLDRVEGEAPGGERRAGAPRTPIAADVAPCDAQPADALPVPAPVPVRFVRHRLGRSAPAQATPADLRSLLYAMAAEQERRPLPAELYQHNLTTGELERVQLDPRRQARLRETLIETLVGIESGAYPARPDQLTCQNCPFLLICPA